MALVHLGGIKPRFLAFPTGSPNNNNNKRKREAKAGLI